MALIDLRGIIGSVTGSPHVHPFYRAIPPTMETPELPPVYPPALNALSKVPGNLYSTDTLKKGPDIITGRHKGVEISKAKMPVMVILGNPPYSRHSLNKGVQITQLPSPDKPEPNRTTLVREITNYKSQITNMGCPSDRFKRLRREGLKFFFKPARAVCNFGHCDLEFVCIL